MHSAARSENADSGLTVDTFSIGSSRASQDRPAGVMSSSLMSTGARRAVLAFRAIDIALLGRVVTGCRAQIALSRARVTPRRRFPVVTFCSSDSFC
jgi:hypothetical protein